MLLTLLGAIVLAIALAGTVALIFRTIRRPVPRGVLPLVAGVGMIGFMVWNQNAWYGRAIADLPDSYVVLRTGEFSHFFEPWTYLFPRTYRFMTIDSNAVITNANNPDIKAVEIILAERYTPTRSVHQLVNCANGQAAVFSIEDELDENGLPKQIQWFALESDDPLLEAVCTKQDA